MSAVDPVTPSEWQEAVDTAEFFQALESARMYGLIRGGPAVDQERCDQILTRGRAMGYVPKPLAELCALFLGVPS